MDKYNPLHKLRFLLGGLSDNNEAEQEAIKKYYELLNCIISNREEYRFYYNPETSETEDLDDMSTAGQDDEFKAEKRRCWLAIKDYLDKAERVVRDNIAEEKKHSLNLNALALEIDGIAPEL